MTAEKYSYISFKGLDSLPILENAQEALEINSNYFALVTLVLGKQPWQ